MAKVLPGRSLPPDDPIFSGGVEMFSLRAFRPSSKSSPENTTGATPAASGSAAPASLPDLQNLPEDPVLGAVRANEAARKSKAQSTTGNKKD